MALIVEDGTGKTDAESYESVTDADTYHTNHGGPAGWTGASEPQKETALRIATQYLDAKYNQRWDGTRSNETQRLAFPRTGIMADGYLIESDDMPRALLEATAILALKSLTETLLPDVSAGGGEIKSERDKVGPIESAVEYLSGKNPLKTFSLVHNLIQHLLGRLILERC